MLTSAAATNAMTITEWRSSALRWTSDRASSIVTAGPEALSLAASNTVPTGGGFIGGDLRDIEYAASGLAVAGDVVVVSLNYRLAPEHPYPAGPDDCEDAALWLARGGGAETDGGTWHGRRILDESWIAESTAPRIAVTPQTTGYSEEEFGEYYGRAEDALAWHLGTLLIGDRSVRTYAASGNGGQLLVVAPEVELAMVFTGGNYRQGGIWGKRRAHRRRADSGQRTQSVIRGHG